MAVFLTNKSKLKYNSSTRKDKERKIPLKTMGMILT